MKKFAKVFIALAIVTPILVACSDDLGPENPPTVPEDIIELPIFHETIMPDDLPK